MEEAVEGMRGDRLALVGDGELEAVVAAPRRHPDRRRRIAVGQGVRQQVREELGDPGAVADDRLPEIEAALDGPVRPGGLELADDVLQGLLLLLDHPVEGESDEAEEEGGAAIG